MNDTAGCQGREQRNDEPSWMPHVYPHLPANALNLQGTRSAGHDHLQFVNRRERTLQVDDQREDVRRSLERQQVIALLRSLTASLDCNHAHAAESGTPDAGDAHKATAASAERLAHEIGTVHQLAFVT